MKKLLAIVPLVLSLGSVGVVNAASNLPPQCNQTYSNTFNFTGSYKNFVGTPGNDLIYVTGNYNTIDAGGGNDCVIVTGAFNQISGGEGNDAIFASGSYNTLLGGEGNDYLSGGQFAHLNGGEGTDTCVGPVYTATKASCEL